MATRAESLTRDGGVLMTTSWLHRPGVTGNMNKLHPAANYTLRQSLSSLLTQISVEGPIVHLQPDGNLHPAAVPDLEAEGVEGQVPEEPAEAGRARVQRRLLAV